MRLASQACTHPSSITYTTQPSVLGSLPSASSCPRSPSLLFPPAVYQTPASGSSHQPEEILSLVPLPQGDHSSPGGLCCPWNPLHAAILALPTTHGSSSTPPTPPGPAAKRRWQSRPPTRLPACPALSCGHRPKTTPLSRLATATLLHPGSPVHPSLLHQHTSSACLPTAKSS